MEAEDRMRRVAALLLAVCLGAVPAVAQTGELRALSETYRRDRLELRDYDWTQRTEVTVNGEVTERTVARARYDPDGHLQKTPIGEKDKKKVRGPIRGRRAKKKQKKAAEFTRDLRGLIHSYTQFTPQQMRSAFARASVFPGEGDTEGMIRVQARSVVRQGDSMSMWADAATRRLRRFEILTSLEGEPVEVLTEFRELEGGPAYPATTTVRTERKGKTVVIRTENFDHIREAG
jgi:hypothetical protein